MIALLFNHLWQSTIFAGGLGLLTLLFRRNSANVRFGLWLAASLKFLLPFSLIAMLGAVFAPRQVSEAAATLIVQAGPAALPFAVSRTGAMQGPITLAAPDLTLVLLCLWLTGAAALLLLWAMRYTRLKAVVRQAPPLAWPAAIAVRSSPALMEPGLVGIWRPVLLLPKGIENRLSRAELDAVIAHEMTHARRGDNLTAALHMIVQAIFWFYPLTWWIGKRLVAEREQACDERVVMLGNDPSTYAEGILKVCKFYLHSPLDCASGISGADLKARVEAIMKNRLIERLGSAKKTVLALAAIAAVGTPLLVGMTLTLSAFAPARAEASPGTEQALRHEIEAFEKGRPDYSIMAANVSQNIHAQWPVIAQNMARFGALQSISFRGVDADGMDVYFVRFANGLTSWFVMPLAHGKITALRYLNAFDRDNRTDPSPGTQMALRRQIEAISRHKPALDIMTPEVAAYFRQVLPAVEKTFDAWGPLKSIAFRQVGDSGQDIYDVAFAHGQGVFSIGPLTADGKVSALAGALSFAHPDHGPSPGTEAALMRHISDLQKGVPDYADMTPALAANLRGQMPALLPLIRQWGALDTVRFKSVGAGGMDVYELVFAHGHAQWRIAPLTANGKTQGMSYFVLS